MQTRIGYSLKLNRGWAIALLGLAVVLTATHLSLYRSVVSYDFHLLHPRLLIFATLICGGLAAYFPEGADTFGFRLIPYQGWAYWLRVAIILSFVISVIVLIPTTVAIGLGYAISTENLTAANFSFSSAFAWMCIIGPIDEEVLFRLILCPALVALIGPWPTIFITGAAFAGMHFWYGNPSPDNFVGGFILSWSYLRSGTLVVPLVLHSAGNFLALLSQLAYLTWFAN